MAGQVFQSRSRLRRSILVAARAVAFVAVGALAVVIIASAVAPSGGSLDVAPFVGAPTPTPEPAIISVLNGAGQAINAAASAITAPFQPAATSTPTVTPIPTPVPTAPATQPTPRGGQPSTPPSHTQPPHP